MRRFQAVNLEKLEALAEAERLQKRVVAGQPLTLCGTYRKGTMTFGTADQRAEAIWENQREVMR